MIRWRLHFAIRFLACHRTAFTNPRFNDTAAPPHNRPVYPAHPLLTTAMLLYRAHWAPRHRCTAPTPSLRAVLRMPKPCRGDRVAGIRLFKRLATEGDALLPRKTRSRIMAQSLKTPIICNIALLEGV